MKDYMAIDPIAMILNGEAYVKWCELHHPHVPKVAEIEQLFEHMTHDERNQAVSRAKALVKYGERIVECGKVIANAGQKIQV